MFLVNAYKMTEIYPHFYQINNHKLPYLYLNKSYKTDINNNSRLILEKYGLDWILTSYDAFYHSFYLIRNGILFGEFREKSWSVFLDHPIQIHYIKNNRAYFKQDNMFKYFELYRPDIIHIDHDNWLYFFDRKHEKSALYTAGYFEGILFAVFWFPGLNLFITLDEKYNVYTDHVIFTKFKQLRPIIQLPDEDHNFEHIFQNLYKYGIHLYKTFDNSLTTISKEHISKLHPYNKQITLILLLLQSKLGHNILPTPLIFKIINYIIN